MRNFSFHSVEMWQTHSLYFDQLFYGLEFGDQKLLQIDWKVRVARFHSKVWESDQQTILCFDSLQY